MGVKVFVRWSYGCNHSVNGSLICFVGGQPPHNIRGPRRKAKQQHITPVWACQGKYTNCLLQGHFCFDPKCSQGNGYPTKDEFGDWKCACKICQSRCNFTCLESNMHEIAAFLTMQKMEEEKKSLEVQEVASSRTSIVQLQIRYSSTQSSCILNYVSIIVMKKCE